MLSMHKKMNYPLFSDSSFLHISFFCLSITAFRGAAFDILAEIGLYLL